MNLLAQQRALNAQLNKLRNDAQAIAGRAEADSREMTTAEQQRIDALHAEFESTEAKLEALNSTSLGRVTPTMAVGGARSSGIYTPKSALFYDLFQDAGGADAYAGKFSGLGEFCLTVARGRQDPRLIVNTSISEGSGMSAGYLVPAEYVRQLLDTALDQEAIRPNATVLPMASNMLEAPGFDYQDGTSGKRAGLLLSWGPESGTLAEQVAKARTITFKAIKANILARVSSELTEDAPAFERQLSTAMSAAVAAGLDGAFVSGTGAGQPLGILSAPALITVAKESGQATATLLLQNLTNMVSKLSPASFKRSRWLVHPTVFPSLLALTVIVKNVAGTENVGGGLAAAVVQGADGQLQIFGRPVSVTDACSAFSSAGDVILADLSQYGIGMRREARIDVAREVYFTTDEIGFRLTLRLDGQPLASAATKLRDGSNTVSPFVALGAR